jgi:signal transduction histidine kinase
MATEQIERLFEPFVSASPEGGSPSHGLRLWVSYQITQQLGGSIIARSDVGYTRFTVELPIVEAAQTPEPS